MMSEKKPLSHGLPSRKHGREASFIRLRLNPRIKTMAHWKTNMPSNSYRDGCIEEIDDYNNSESARTTDQQG